MTSDSVLSPDGTTIGYTISGNGPGLLLIHGGFRSGKHYRRLADLLSQRFTVYVMDRRGRSASGPRKEPYNIDQERDDAMAIVKKHGIRLAFGHSFGGWMALEMALLLPMKKIALYEPAVYKDGFPAEWLPRFREQLAKDDIPGALLTSMKGMEMAGPLAGMPEFLVRMLFRALSFLKGKTENRLLLGVLPGEVELVSRQTGHGRFTALTTPVLLLEGEQTPAYIRKGLQQLAELLPNDRVITLPKVGHNAPDEENPEAVATVLLRFFEAN